IGIIEKKYRDVVQFAIEAICVIQDGMFKFYNPEAVKLFGYSEDELSDLPSEETIYPEDRELVTASRMQRLQGDYVLGIYSHRIITKDGRILWVEIRAVSITWNHLPAALVFLTDITERKKAEEALIESNERYIALFDRLQDAVYINDFEGNFVDANAAALKMLGYSKDEIHTLNFASLIDTPDLEKAYEALQEIIETGTQKKPNQLRVKKKNGDFVWMESTGALINQDGKPHAIQGIARDISQSKEVEEQLKFAKEQAEAASLTKSQFLTNMSHELRTPMQGILGFASLGIQRIDDLSKEKYLDYFQEIYSSGHRLMTLLNGLLDLSKLESGKTEYNFKIERLFSVVETIVNEFKALTQEKKILIIFQKPGFDDRVNIDKEKIFQVIRNLLANAVKFSTPKTKILIKIAYYRQYLRISVTDKGVGIPADELKSVFDKFTQSSKTRSGAGGTGLGLAICMEIIKAHKGKIWADNNPEGGTTFSFELPSQQKPI
ncbi:MAG: PAS domain-containing sensor histidine kinase, partial [Deltaproteobacteria bacterium]|nr:PAS domain-containing sensor histidine kinase [Deltaproteobacteria bacterium]